MACTGTSKKTRKQRRKRHSRIPLCLEPNGGKRAGSMEIPLRLTNLPRRRMDQCSMRPDSFKKNHLNSSGIPAATNSMRGKSHPPLKLVAIPPSSSGNHLHNRALSRNPPTSTMPTTKKNQKAMPMAFKYGPIVITKNPAKSDLKQSQSSRSCLTPKYRLPLASMKRGLSDSTIISKSPIFITNVKIPLQREKKECNEFDDDDERQTNQTKKKKRKKMRGCPLILTPLDRIEDNTINPISPLSVKLDQKKDENGIINPKISSLSSPSTSSTRSSSSSSSSSSLSSPPMHTLLTPFHAKPIIFRPSPLSDVSFPGREDFGYGDGPPSSPSSSEMDENELYRGLTGTSGEDSLSQAPLSYFTVNTDKISYYGEDIDDGFGVGL